MNIASEKHQVVSCESEQLILVNEADEPVGFASKGECHDGKGVLHRAFSLFIFDSDGRLLLQQRSPEKRLWGGYWSNSCCSHPRAGERMDQAIHRRLEQELGITAELEYLYKFQYQAQFSEEGAENELCWVYLGRTSDPVQPNATEISDWRFLDPEAVSAELESSPERFTPWFKLEWARIRSQYQDTLEKYAPLSSRQP